MNVIARLEFELIYCDSAVHRLNHYTTKTPTTTDCLRIIIYTLPPVCWAINRGITSCYICWNAKLFSWNESTLVADSIHMNIYLKDSFTYTEIDDSSRVRYLIDVKSAGFQSQLKVSHVSSHTEELWYNEKVSLGMTIYIYIYIYIHIWSLI